MTKYYVGVDDMYAVEADSEEEAEQKLLERFEEGDAKATMASVLDVAPET